MKRILTITALILALVLPAKAATAINFLGVSMDYKIDAFCQKLVSSHGYTITEKTSDEYILQGTYMGIKKCSVSVRSHSDGGKVAVVVVTFPKQKTWEELRDQYNDVRLRFRVSTQYRFLEESASFSSPYSDGCGNELEAVQQDKCDYYTLLSKGDNLLLLGIDSDQTVKVFYVDANTASALFSSMGSSSSSASSSSSSSSSSSTPASAQSSSETLTFLGLPMRGNYKDFAQRLINEREFTLEHETPSVPSISLRGVIDGMDNSEVYVFGDSNTKVITHLDVYLPELYTWSEILEQYQSYKEFFSNNYPVLDESTGFDTQCAGNEVQAVRNDECNYASIFQLPGGKVVLQISVYMQVEISYYCD